VEEEVADAREEVKEAEVKHDEAIKEISEILEDVIISAAESRVYESVKNSYEILQDQETRLKEIVKETLKREMPYIVSEVYEKMSGKQFVDNSCQCMNQEIKIEKKRNEKMDKILYQIKEFGKN